MLRAARDAIVAGDAARLTAQTERMASALERLHSVTTLDEVCGMESNAAHAYSQALPLMVRPRDARDHVAPADAPGGPRSTR